MIPSEEDPKPAHRATFHAFSKRLKTSSFESAVTSKRIVILHGFIKKTDRTPAKELKIARDRLKELKP